jgi:hypothetical protein
VTIPTYFDMNVFNDLYEKRSGITEQHVKALRAAIRAGKIFIPLSAHICDEMLSDSESHTNRATEKLGFILSLVDQHRMAKAVEQLLYDDIWCYAQGQALSSPFMGDVETLEILSNLRSLSNPTHEGVSDHLADACEVRKQKRDFVDEITQARAQVHVELSGIRQQPPSFDSYRRSSPERVIEDLVNSALISCWARRQEVDKRRSHVGALDACRRRGLMGMLDIRSVRMYVGLYHSYVYAQTYERGGPQRGDSWDMKHAIVAAATSDVFVTHDGTLTALLARVPITGFKVVTLHDLLGQTC